MSKVKNRERKQRTHADAGTHSAGAHSSEYAQDPEMMKAGEPMRMPSASEPVAHKKQKRFGHN